MAQVLRSSTLRRPASDDAPPAPRIAAMGCKQAKAAAPVAQPKTIEPVKAAEAAAAASLLQEAAAETKESVADAAAAAEAAARAAEGYKAQAEAAAKAAAEKQAEKEAAAAAEAAAKQAVAKGGALLEDVEAEVRRIVPEEGAENTVAAVPAGWFACC
mmetsp:Transcript_38781/g.102517  ORF Transcript_38781/g.102517 Transcript_38781/m.102517 type:complete len:158 (+) Transcript_38781:3-476(+)